TGPFDEFGTWFGFSRKHDFFAFQVFGRAFDPAVDAGGFARDRAFAGAFVVDFEREFDEIEDGRHGFVPVHRQFADAAAGAVFVPFDEFGAEVRFGDQGDFGVEGIRGFAFFGRPAFDFAFDFARAGAFGEGFEFDFFKQEDRDHELGFVHRHFAFRLARAIPAPFEEFGPGVRFGRQRDFGPFRVFRVALFGAASDVA